MESFKEYLRSDEGYIVIGFFFLMLSLALIFRNSVYYSMANTLWFCDFSLVLFSIAFFLRNLQFIKGLINIGLLAQFIYILELILYVSFGISLSEIPALTMNSGLFNIIYSVSIHLFSANLALYVTVRRRTKRISLMYSGLIIVFLYALTILLTPPSMNVNYIFSSEFLFGLNIPLYIYLWPLLAFIVLVIPTYRLQRYLNERYS
jgi:hypothetical protein